MLFLVFLWVNKPTVNGYFIRIDVWSGGEDGEIECWNSILSPQLDDFWYVIECVVDVVVIFYKRINVKYLV